METFLRRWWTKKYKLPWTHDCFQDLTIEELLTEYYEDYYEENPSAARKAMADEDGEYYFESTGDPLLDKWESELKRGLTPDFEEEMSAEARAQLKAERERINRTKTAINNFSKEINDPLRSKYVVAGSKEEQELLKNKTIIRDISEDWTDLLGND